MASTANLLLPERKIHLILRRPAVAVVTINIVSRRRVVIATVVTEITTKLAERITIKPRAKEAIIKTVTEVAVTPDQGVAAITA